MANKTILDKLNELQDAKEDIQAAIREKGGVVSDDTLAGLADDIRDIPQDGYAWGSIGWSDAPDEWQQMVNDARAYKEAWDALEIKPPVNEYFRGFSEMRMVPNLSEFETLTNGNGLFSGCKKLQYIPEDADFKNVTDAGSMFRECAWLEDISMVKLSPLVTKIEGTFFNSGVKVIPAWETGNCTSFATMTLQSKVEKITSLDASSATTLNFNQIMPQTGISVLIKNIGKPQNTSSINWGSASKLGVTDKYPEARQALIDTLITYSYDRATAGYSSVTITLHNDVKARLTASEIAAITAKGFTLA